MTTPTTATSSAEEGAIEHGDDSSTASHGKVDDDACNNSGATDIEAGANNEEATVNVATTSAARDDAVIQAELELLSKIEGLVDEEKSMEKGTSPPAKVTTADENAENHNGKENQVQPSLWQTMTSPAFCVNFIVPVSLLTLIALVSTALCIVLFQYLKEKDEEWAPGVDQVHSIRRMNAIQSYMIAHGVSTQESFASSIEEDSPRLRAAEWLAWMDPARLDIPDTSTEPTAAYTFVERYVLAVLYFATGGTNWERQLNFLTQDNVCHWTDTVDSKAGEPIQLGVICNDEGMVTEINLNGNGLRGELPIEMTRLMTLTSIQMGSNQGLTGELPSDFHLMPRLESLALSRNDLSGTLPSNLCGASNLRQLYLGFNSLQGSLPSCLDSLVKLETLFLSNNMLSGEIPSALSNLKNLQLLWLDDNLFSGDVSTTFNHMPLLRAIYIEDNNLEGVIGPDFLRDSKGLVQLDVSDNRLEGNLPPHFFAQNEFPSLEVMDWHGNELSGKLPEVSNPNQVLQFLAVYKNNFDGPLPLSWGTNLQGLFHLDVSRNQLEGDLPLTIGSMSGLVHLFLGQNNWTPGPIPAWVGSLTQLRELSFKSSRRTGALPIEELSKLSQLVFLDLDDNALTGPIPGRLSELVNLEFLLLNRNQLTGVIPSSLGQLDKLRAAFLEGNFLSGSLNELCRVASFAKGDASSSGESGLLVSDCAAGGPTSLPPVECDCCNLCCETATPDDSTTRPFCHDWTGPANLNPRWESVYSRVTYVFGNQVWFTAHSD